MVASDLSRLHSNAKWPARSPFISWLFERIVDAVDHLGSRCQRILPLLDRVAENLFASTGIGETHSTLGKKEASMLHDGDFGKVRGPLHVASVEVASSLLTEHQRVQSKNIIESALKKRCA